MYYTPELRELHPHLYKNCFKQETPNFNINDSTKTDGPYEYDPADILRRNTKHNR